MFDIYDTKSVLLYYCITPLLPFIQGTFDLKWLFTAPHYKKHLLHYGPCDNDQDIIVEESIFATGGNFENRGCCWHEKQGLCKLQLIARRYVRIFSSLGTSSHDSWHFSDSTKTGQTPDKMFTIKGFV